MPFTLAKYVATGEIAPKRVTHVHNRPIVDMNSFFALTLTTGTQSEVLRVTGEHPFWVKDRAAWVNVTDLIVGDTLLDYDGNPVRLVAKKPIPKFELTYNLTVDDFHTYFAGKLDVLVHNCSGADLIKNGGKELSNGSIVGAYGNYFTKNADGTYSKVGKATPDQIRESGVNVRPDPATNTGTKTVSSHAANVQALISHNANPYRKGTTV